MGPRAEGTNHPLRGRDAKALRRRNELAKKYMAEGMSEEDALARAQEEMRDNAKGDWRRG
jgi:hypothetical protein